MLGGLGPGARVLLRATALLRRPGRNPRREANVVALGVDVLRQRPRQLLVADTESRVFYTDPWARLVG